jgi:hypothetical protein
MPAAIRKSAAGIFRPPHLEPGDVHLGIECPILLPAREFSKPFASRGS